MSERAEKSERDLSACTLWIRKTNGNDSEKYFLLRNAFEKIKDSYLGRVSSRDSLTLLILFNSFFPELSIRLRATINLGMIFKLSLHPAGSQIKIHRRETSLGRITRRQVYFPLAAPINGHPVYAMPTRIGACSYRGRYPLFMLSLAFSHVPAVVGGDDIRAVIEATLRPR